jgi:uncharacterized membrane protein
LVVAEPRDAGESGSAAPLALAPRAGRLRRLARHLFCTRAGTRRLFPRTLLQQIEQACAAAEMRHDGEIRFAVESALPPVAILHGITPRARALALFSQLRMWDTQDNNGVLIYVLRADRAVEIIADRGISARVPPGEWAGLCAEVEGRFRLGRFAEGSHVAVEGVARLLERHFPVLSASPANELPNQPLLL